MIVRSSLPSIQLALEQDRHRACFVRGMGRQVDTRHVPALTPELGQVLDELEQRWTVLAERDLLDAVFDTRHPGSSDRALACCTGRPPLQ
jgi:hypothetical protein